MKLAIAARSPHPWGVICNYAQLLVINVFTYSLPTKEIDIKNQELALRRFAPQR
jgi:hypothetical protein